MKSHLPPISRSRLILRKNMGFSPRGIARKPSALSPSLYRRLRNSEPTDSTPPERPMDSQLDRRIIEALNLIDKYHQISKEKKEVSQIKFHFVFARVLKIIGIGALISAGLAAMFALPLFISFGLILVGFPLIYYSIKNTWIAYQYPHKENYFYHKRILEDISQLLGDEISLEVLPAHYDIYRLVGVTKSMTRVDPQKLRHFKNFNQDLSLFMEFIRIQLEGGIYLRWVQFLNKQKSDSSDLDNPNHLANLLKSQLEEGMDKINELFYGLRSEAPTPYEKIFFVIENWLEKYPQALLPLKKYFRERRSGSEF